MNLDEAFFQVQRLATDLQRIADKDQEQDVLGIAVPVVDVTLREAREHLPEGDPLIEAARDVISVENIEAGEPVRAIDLLIVVRQLEQRLSSIRSAAMTAIMSEPLSRPAFSMDDSY